MGIRSARLALASIDSTKIRRRAAPTCFPQCFPVAGGTTRNSRHRRTRIDYKTGGEHVAPRLMIPLL